jgi:hypothetical protein
MPGQDSRMPAGFFANAGSRQYSEPEIMLRIEQVLTPLDDAARARIVSWMISRFGAAAAPEPGDGGQRS